MDEQTMRRLRGVAFGPQDFSDNGAELESSPPAYIPGGKSPLWYWRRGITKDHILLGTGFLERGSAVMLGGQSGIGKSSIAMQLGNCWACGKSSFNLAPPRALRIALMQNEDSHNDLVRQSESLNYLGLSAGELDLVDKNFLIETVRGKIGSAAIAVMEGIIHYHKPDILMLNPLSAYHQGDISQNSDNIDFLYSKLGALLDETQVGLFAFHHKTKPPKNAHSHQDAYHDLMYEVLGGSALTNFFRGIITVGAMGESDIFKFTVAKRFTESGWPLKTQLFKWHQDRDRRIWVHASASEAQEAKAKDGSQSPADLYRLVPATGSIHKAVLINKAMQAKFTERSAKAVLEECLDDCCPDSARLYLWLLRNTEGAPKKHISRFPHTDQD